MSVGTTSTGLRRLDLAPGERAPLATTGEGALVYVVDGVLQTGHPEPALRRALRGEFVYFCGGEAAVAINASRRDPLSLVALAGLPATAKSPPLARYFSDDDKAGRLCLAATPGGTDGTLALAAPIRVFVTRLASRDTIVFEPDSPHVVAFLISGRAQANRAALEPGRPQRIQTTGAVRLATDDAAHLLVLDFQDNDQ